MANYLSDQDFELFSNVIYKQSGIHFSSSNRTVLESRLRERLRASKVSTVKEYYELIISSDEEMRNFLDAVTTNLTRFFRNTAHFQAFENDILPNLTEYKVRKNCGHIRIWSAGCSTGEEPYSIAIILKEKVDPHFKLEVIGSDLSLKSLMTAKEGYYPDSKIEGIPAQYLNKYFEKKRDGYQIRDGLKSLVRLDYHNLKHDSSLKDVDVVFCRNVLIYFDNIAQKEVVEKFWCAMSVHSFLFIGHSESLFGMDTKFEFTKNEWSCYYRKFIEP